ncbi:MAG: hypothetical protein ACXWOV_17480, partial [Isosphaeraceae bacterium]
LLETDLVERVKNAAYWNPRLTMRWLADRPAQERRTHKQGGYRQPGNTRVYGFRVLAAGRQLVAELSHDQPPQPCRTRICP